MFPALAFETLSHASWRCCGCLAEVMPSGRRRRRLQNHAAAAPLIGSGPGTLGTENVTGPEAKRPPRGISILVAPLPSRAGSAPELPGVIVKPPPKLKSIEGITWRDWMSPAGFVLHQWAMNHPGHGTVGASWLPEAVNRGELSLLTLSPLKIRDRSESKTAAMPRPPMAVAS